MCRARRAPWWVALSLLVASCQLIGGIGERNIAADDSVAGDASAGGSSAGEGGSSAGEGGSSAGNGGSTAGNGGSTAGNGGSTAGNGGSSADAVADSGAGGMGLEDRAIVDAGPDRLEPPFDEVWLTFDDCVDAIDVLRDDTGSGHHGLKQGEVKCVDGRKGGKAIYFHGNYDPFVTVPPNVTVGNSNSLLSSEAFTVAAWVLVEPSAVAGERTIVNKWYTPDSFMLLTNQDSFGFWVALDGVSPWKTVYAPLVTGLWTHVAGVFDGRTATLYVNGEPRAQTDAVGKVAFSTHFVAVGGWPFWNLFLGAIDDVRVANRAFSSAEIRQIFGLGGPVDDASPASPAAE